MFTAPITVWRFPRGSAASKTLSADADGNLVKTNPNFPPGLGHTVIASLANIAARHADVGNPAVLLYGLPFGRTFEGAFVIASAADANSAGWRPEKIFAGLPATTDVFTRDRGTFVHAQGQPGYMLIDVDAAGLSAEQVLRSLAAAAPEILSAPSLVLPSSSGFVAVAGREPKPGGWHVLIGVQDAGDIRRAMRALFDRLWLVEGAHWTAVSAAGGLLPRTFVDLATSNPAQPHFFQAPILKDGVQRFAPEPSIRNPNADGLDTRVALPDPSPVERALIEAAKAASAQAAEPEAERVRNERATKAAELAVAQGDAEDFESALAAEMRKFEMSDRGLLDPGTTLHFDHFGWVDAPSMFADPLRYDGQTLADPLEPEYGGTFGRPGRNKAVCRLVQGGRAFEIVSLAHSAGNTGRKFTLVDAAFDPTDLFTGVTAGAAAGPDALALFEAIEVPAPEIDVDPKDRRAAIRNAFFSSDGLPEFDPAAAVVVAENGPLRLMDVGPAFEHDDIDHGAALVRSLAASGAKAQAIVCGDGAGAMTAALELSRADSTGIASRVDIYGWTPKHLEAFKLEPRADHCKKPKALAGATKFAPRSIGAILCATGEAARCGFFEACGFIQNRAAAADHMLVEASPSMALAELNALLGETAGPIGVFPRPEVASEIVQVPASDFRSIGGAYADFCHACIAGAADTAGAIRRIEMSSEQLKSIEDAARKHGVAAGPAASDEETANAIRMAALTSATTVPKHQIAYAMFMAFHGHAQVVVETKKGITSKGVAHEGPVLRFVIERKLVRAAAHRAAVALLPMPLRLCDPAAIGVRLFGKPVRAVSGGRRKTGPIFQCADSLMRGKRTTGSLCAALMAVGRTPAVVASGDTITGALPFGVPVLNPADDLPDAVDVVIWLEKLWADDFAILKLAAAAGRQVSSTDFRIGAGFWANAAGRRLAAPVWRPVDDFAEEARKIEAWRPVFQMLGDRTEVAAIVFNSSPCPLPVTEVLMSSDLAVEDPSALTAAVAKALDCDSLDAAMRIAAVLRLDDDSTLLAALEAPASDAVAGRMIAMLSTLKKERTAP